MSSKKHLIDISLHLHKIGKQEEHYVSGKDGAKYLDVRLIELEDNKYSDYMLVRKTSKEEYEKGVKGDILGYAKDWEKHQGESKGANPKNDNNKNDAPEGSDDLPF